MSELTWLVGLPLAGAVLVLLLRRWSRLCGVLAGSTLIAAAVGTLHGAAPQTLKLLGETLALTQAASRSLCYAYVIIGIASIASARRGQDGLVYGLVLASAALTSAALSARSMEIMAFSTGGALLCLALAAPLTHPERRLQSMRSVSLLALLPLLLMAPLWVLEIQQVPPIDESALQSASVLAVVAAGLLLGLFPLHLWRVSLYSVGHPAIILSVATLASLLGLQYLVRFLQVPAWPRFWELARPLLLYGGALTALVGGTMSAVHVYRREVIGYASLAYWGGTVSGVAQALPDSSATATMDLWLGSVALLAAATAFWSLDSRTMKSETRPERENAGQGWLCRATLAVGILGLSGLPLAASFPVRLADTLQIAAEDGALGLALLAGSVGVGWGALQSARRLPSEPRTCSREILPRLLPCALALCLAVLLCLAFLFPALLRALPAAWLPDLMGLY
jgi:NADH:ubiquinone oxidoreductase subunit 2 (subunit N)